MRSAFITLIIAVVIVMFFVRAAAHRAGVAFTHAFSGHSDRAYQMQTSSPTIGAFHALTANGAINVEIHQGPKTSLTFHARQDTLAKLTADVVDGTLTIGVKEGWNDSLGQVSATIETPDIDAVTVNGSGNVELREIKTPKLAVSINGSSQVNASGAADSATFAIFGSGNVNAERLLADAVVAKISGSGDIHVDAIKTLDASISGSGDISYKGHPNVSKEIAGSGSISGQDQGE